MENLLTGHQGPVVFSCCFCGGDHGATECMESLCPNCFKSVCEHQQEPDERVNSAEAIQSIDDCITDIVPADEWDELEIRFPTELPIELFAHVVATYRIPDHLAYLNDLFSVAPPHDGRQWNRSRKHGNCYKFCYDAQQDEAEKIRRLAGTDGDISVVQGFVRGRTGAYVGHCWLKLAEPWFVYIVRCAGESLYTGIAKDVDRRLEQHNAGTASRYTRSRLPVTLKYQDEQPNQSSALKRELAIKAMSRKAKEALIQSVK